jgi:hypothetical protein
VTYIIWPEAPYLEISWSSILNQSNIEGWNWEYNLNYTKKNLISIKRTRIKIKIQNKFYIWLKGEIEKNNNFYKRAKKKI